MSTQLWILRPLDKWTKDRPVKVGNPWEPWENKAFGFVVEAADEQEARRLASSAGREEVRSWRGVATAWLSPKYSTCVPLTPTGESGVVMRDYCAA